MAKQKPKNRLVEFRDRHRGETILVCGCGRSIKTLDLPAPVTTIGVNDIGRCFTPDYLVVLNAKSQFKGDRFRFVESSEASAVFTQLDLGLAHTNVVRFSLGERGGTDLSSDTRLPFTRNSPYVALCLAAFMGARRIGLIGVDFSDDHFFASTGRHPLRRELGKINREYGKLAEALAGKSVEVFNLSRDSLLDSLPRLDAAEFFSGHRLPAAAGSRKQRKSLRRAATIQVEKHRGDLIGGFFDELASTARELGYRVQRRVTAARPGQSTVSIVWNGRRYRGQNNIIYCEHGWLPRDAYQVSPAGINADSHLAPFVWDHNGLDDSQRKSVSA